LDLLVARKNDRKLGSRHLKRVEHCSGSTLHVSTQDPAIRAIFDNEPDGHQVTDLLSGPYADAARV
jgi:hypothetical protein